MVCRYCKKNKEEAFFIKNKRTKDGQKGTCKECKSKADKEYREKNKEKLSKYFNQLWNASYKRRTKNKESNYIENGKKPIHDDLAILCVSCHTSHAVKNKQHSSFDNSKALLKGWETRRSKNEIRKS